MSRNQPLRRKARRHIPPIRLTLERLEPRLALAALASAGSDQDVDRGSLVVLDAAGSTGTGALGYVWTQKSGPDVTSGVGILSGAAPSFIAPARVVTLEFDLVVSDSDGASSPDRIVIAVLEDHDDALFVSPFGSDTNPGTRAAPLLHIQAAIAKAAAQGDDVYVAAGTYPESLSLATGVSIYGGFDGSSWLRDPAIYVTTISGGPTAVVGNNVQNSVLNGLTINSANASLNGSSIAIALSGATNLELSGNIIRAGTGGNGTDGNNGTPGSTSAVNGNDGQPGSADGAGLRLGGPQTVGPEFGGKGGDGGSEGRNDGQGGSPGSGGAAGGAGGDSPGGGLTSCNDGEDGTNGSPGANGAQGSAGGGGANFGIMIGLQYAPANGNNGMRGTNGRGGGGGGGGGGQGGVACDDGAGNGGGSGGQGGLGGDFGSGGAGGGASIALVLVNSSGVSIHDNVISSANGGNGGSGGSGVAGGQGGAGGRGATAFTDEVGAGGNGGRGGNGGGGGHGGGGGGGPSIGIFLKPGSTGSNSNSSIATGMAGAGGISAGPSSANGATGIASKVSGSGITLSPPNVMSLSTSTIVENQPPGALVGDLSTMNSSAGAPFTYALVAGIGDDNNPSFAISGDQLVTARPLDFEARSSLSVRVRSTDAGGASVEMVYPISVTNNNDAPSCTIGPQQNTNDESGLQSILGWLKNCSAGAPDEAEQELSVALTVDRPELFTTPPALDEFGTLIYDPAPNVRGAAIVTVQISDDGGTANGGVSASPPMMLSFNVAKPRPWRNAAKNLDVTDDDHIVAADALDNINFLNAFGSLELPPRDTISKPYYDVNGDGFIAANDALDIINFLNAGLGGEGEGGNLSTESKADNQNQARVFDEFFALLAADEVILSGRRRARL